MSELDERPLCELLRPEANDFPCNHPGRFIYLDLVQSERIGKPKTITVCLRHNEFVKFSNYQNIEAALLGIMR